MWVVFAVFTGGQRLDIIVPIIIKKLEKIADSYSLKVVQLLKEHAPAPADDTLNTDWQKKVRQVKIHRSLERMNTTALVDLAGSELFASNVLEALHDLRQNHFSFSEEAEGNLTVFSVWGLFFLVQWQDLCRQL